MAKESFDKEIQFLRMLVLTSGAFSRQQFADRLGISIHTFDKTLKKLKDVAGSMQQHTGQESSKDFFETIRFNYYDNTDPLLLFLYRAKSVKETESARISFLIAALHNEPLTVVDLLDRCSSFMLSDLPLPDEKTIRSDLKYLEQVGVVIKIPGPRPYKYTLHNALITQLSDEELTDLYHFVDVMANTQIPSVQGYLLRDALKKQLVSTGTAQHELESLLYKYHYYYRILDEAHLFTILYAINRREKLSFLYYSPKSEKRYTAKNSNPLFERDDPDGKEITTLPLKIVYDHQYGRWYLLSYDREGIIRKFRIEGITQIQEKGSVDEQYVHQKIELLDKRIQYSWLVDTGRPVKIRARFFHPGESEPNFIRARVLQQGQWGNIVEEEATSFIYEITVNGTYEIKPWLRSFGSSCEVLEPMYLRREMIAEWKEIVAYYESI